jgi:hypothetical protein
MGVTETLVAPSAGIRFVAFDGNSLVARKGTLALLPLAGETENVTAAGAKPAQQSSPAMSQPRETFPTECMFVRISTP